MDYSRTMYGSKLEVKRGYDGIPDHRYDMLIDEAEEALFPNKYIPAGLVFSRDTTGKKVKIGCVGNKVPYYLFNPTDRPMSALSGIVPSNTAAASGGYLGAGDRKMRFYSGMGHFEVSTTEYAKPSSYSYAVDDPLTAPGFATPATYDANAGKVAKTTYTGVAVIVGIVSLPCTEASPSTNEHKTPALHFTTCFIPNRKVTAGS